MPTWLRDRWRRATAHRLPGLRTAKLTLAAVLAYLAARALDTSPDSILAPLTALLVVQTTLFRTVASAAARVVSVLAGVSIAVGLASLFGLTWWSLGAVVGSALVLGRLLRLRDNLLEVPISGMIVLAVGGAAKSAATGRFLETIVGGAVGVLVNLAIAPPLHVRPAEEAVGRLADTVARAMDELAAELGSGWSRSTAERWLHRVRDLRHDVDRADADLQRAEESARLNPRGARARGAQPRLRAGLSGLELCAVSLRNVCRAMVDRAASVADGDEPYTEDVRRALADVLTTSAGAVRSVGAFSAASSPVDATLAAVGAGVNQLRERRDQLAALLVVDPATDQGAWQTHGSLLAAVDRMRVEVETAVHPPEQSWRPPPLAQRQREAVRRVVSPHRRGQSA